MELERLKKRRTAVKASLTRLHNTLTLFTGSLAQLQVRTSEFKNWLQQFREIQIEIELLDEDAESNEMEEFEERYYKAADLIDEITTRLSPSHPSIIETHRDQSTPTSLDHRSSLSSDSHIKLPTIQLPTFSGNIQEWMSFSEIFKSLIDENNSISPVQKFHYLLSSLKGEAANLISNLEITTVNYPIAWRMIVDQYENNRLIVQSHINALFALKQMRTESESEIRELINTASQHLRALKALKRPVNSWDDLTVHLIATKFDPLTKREWQSFQKSSTDLPSYEDLERFLAERRRMLVGLSSERVDVTRQKARSAVHNASATTPSCSICQANHYATQCPELQNLTAVNRIQKVKDAKLCMNCLRKGHYSTNCNSKYSCKTCGRKHHTLLHIKQDQSDNAVERPNEGIATSNATVSLCYNPTNVLLPTAMIKITDVWGNNHSARTLLDSGSQIHLITEELTSRLGLETKSLNLSISGISKTSSCAKSYTSSFIASNHSSFKTYADFIVLKQIAGPIPAMDIDINDLSIPHNIKLADPNFYKAQKIDLLLGADIFYNLLCVGQISLGTNKPTLQKTKLGWVTSGHIKQRTTTSAACNLSNINLEHSLRKFWEIEQYENSPSFNLDEQLAEITFKKHVTRDDSGRFVVPLIFKKPNEEPLSHLGDSKETATKRLYSIEAKLLKNPAFKSDYVDFMKQYEILGHMKLIDNETHEKRGYYLPHHGVIKKSSTTTKLRVVFDGSAKTTNNKSLNEILLPGPSVQQTIFSILLRFRTRRYALTADIVKMYRQVLIRQEDRYLQRILWREDINEPIKTYELQTVTYGTTCAAYLATRVLQELSFQIDNTHPQTAKIIRQDFYVDDLLTGANSIEEVLQLREELINIFDSAGFPLQKWRSNIGDIQRKLGDDEKTKTWSCGTDEKTLGVSWNSSSDDFHYSVHENVITCKPTKRNIISAVAKIFDPLGLLSPVTIIAKIMIQNIWEAKVDWDESLPMNLHSTAVKYFDDISTLSELRIPRFIGPSQCDGFDLHGFADASESAYGACIYRCYRNAERNFSSLICAKTRVTPLKRQTLPRLELCAAVLLTQLLQQVLASLGQPPRKIYYYSDSIIVLSWIRSSSRRFQTFVGNRIGKIQQNTNIQDWHHVRTNENPADLCSRGIQANDLLHNHLWWHGPSWLRDSEFVHPSVHVIDEESLPEVKSLIIQTEPAVTEVIDSSRFSSWHRLVRSLAFALRFIRKMQKYSIANYSSKVLTSEEIEQAKLVLLKQVQHKHFQRELCQLKLKQDIYSKSPLLSLSPFLDDNGLIRVGGRLKNAKLPYPVQHPIILPPNEHVVDLIIRHQHNEGLHSGIQTTLALLRQNFWIIRGKNSVKRIIRRCITCLRTRPVLVTPKMGNLPENRVTFTRPFLITGVDYLGPIIIKDGYTRTRKTIKAYIALFICLATKAIHLEVVTNLSTATFLAALRRFIARRGKPKEINSDNATNFVGATNEMKELHALYLEENQNILMEKLASEQIRWKFIPPRSPNFGGVWEAGVKLFKHHFKRVIGESLLTYEELFTLTSQIESILNSRPLTPISDDPNDLTFLTPFHFLIGDYPTSIPEPSLLSLKLNNLSRWQLVQRLQQHFWKRWQQDYLTTQQRRTKWKQTSPITIGKDDLVIIYEDGQPPLRWKMGRVESLQPGNDNVNRVVTVRTSSGLCKRAVNRLSKLPIE